MDSLLKLSKGRFARPSTYGRTGFDSFAISGILDVIPRLESVDRGKFYSMSYRLADFDETISLAAFVDARFSNIPTNGSLVIFDGVSYTFRNTIDDTLPGDVAKGTNYADSAHNLVAAINRTDADAGTRYSSATVAHPTCHATWDGDAICRVIYSTPGITGSGKIAQDFATNISLTRKVFDGGGPMKGDSVVVDGLTYNVTDIGYDAEGGVQLRLELKSL